jgi:hypothetical protein
MRCETCDMCESCESVRSPVRSPDLAKASAVRSIPAAPIHAPHGEPTSLNHAVRCVRDLRDVRRRALTGAPTTTR